MTRDNERQRVYDAEMVAFTGSVWEHPVGLAECQRLVDVVCASPFWRIESTVDAVRVVAARQNSMRSTASIERAEIRLAFTHDTIATVAHELAHLAAGHAVAHGARFRGMYVAMLELFGVPDAAAMLRRAFDNARLDIDVVESVMVDSPVTKRVAALLDKAASTTFSAESDAFAEKAAELIERHRLDVSSVEQNRLGAEDIIGERLISLPAGPYIAAQTRMLDVAATAYGARALYQTTAAGRSVYIIGRKRDVTAAVALWTSLNAHAAAALAAAKPVGKALSFRRSFLFGYASKAAQLLTPESGSTGTAAARTAAPALVALEVEIDQFVWQRHGRIGHGRATKVSHGYDAGRAAAEAMPRAGRHVGRSPRALGR